MKNILIAMIVALSMPVYAQQVAGVIKNKDGNVDIVRKGETISANVGDKLFEGDSLKTSSNSSVGVMLKDESRMSAGSNSQVALDKFKFNPDTNNGNVAISVIKGTFAMISGLVTKHNFDSAVVKTPTSTAGIRGTYFVVEVP